MTAVADMHLPVRCTHCLSTYDLSKIKPTLFWLFGKQWVAPCCKREVDDQWELGLDSEPDYKRLKRRPFFPCDRCPDGRTEYVLCDPCRDEALRITKADGS